MHSGKMPSPPTSAPSPSSSSSSSSSATTSDLRLARVDQKRRIHRARATNLRVKLRARTAPLTAANIAAATTTTTTNTASTFVSPPPSSPSSSTATSSSGAPSIFSASPPLSPRGASSSPPPPTPPTDADLLAFRAALARNAGVLADLGGYVRVYSLPFFARAAAVTTRRAQLLDVLRRLDVCFDDRVRRVADGGARPGWLDPAEDGGLADQADAQLRSREAVAAAAKRELRRTLDAGYRRFDGDFGALFESDGRVKMSASRYREP